jgi:hypothetical protein
MATPPDPYRHTAAMKPFFPEDTSRELEHLAIKLIRASARLSEAMHPVTRGAVAVRRSYLRPVFFCVFLLLLKSSTIGQLWAPEGAIWEYNLSGSFSQGCETRIYLGDTLFEGRNAQQFSVTHTIMNYVSGLLTTTVSTHYTSVEDNIVYAWTGVGYPWYTEPTEWSWDTLYWFGAQIGDRWWPPGLDSSVCGGSWGMQEVVEKDLVEIGGEQLLRLQIAILDENGNVTWPYLQIIERLGPPTIYRPGVPCVLASSTAALRTYVDDDLLQYDSGASNYCDDLTSGQEEPPAFTRMKPYPNPSAGILHIPLDAGSQLQEITFIDPSGRVVKSMSRPTLPVDITDLCTGIYLAHLKVDGRQVQVRIIKQ